MGKAIPIYIGDWTWRLFLKSSGLDLGHEEIVAKRERIEIVAAVLGSLLRSRCLRPARLWAMSRTPKWIAKRRLQHMGHGWHRVPTQAACEHCSVRFDIRPLNVDDLIQFRKRQVVAIAYSGRHHCEILRFLPNGDLEPDIAVPSMQRAWEGYWRSFRKEMPAVDAWADTSGDG